MAVCLYLAAPLCPATATCVPAVYDGQARVSHVIDGDTLITGDATRIRLIGVDTPELGRDGSPDRPGATAARDFLRALLPEHSTIVLQRDTEPHDRHGRRLAHVFRNGENVQQRLLAGGYAVELTVPPNLGFLPCYQNAVGQARQERRGLWALDRYQVRDVAQLPQTARGYYQLRGSINRIGNSTGSLWLNLGEGFAARIVKTDLVWFSSRPLQDLYNRTVLVRGRVYRRNGQLRLRLRHESALEILPR